MPKKPAPAVAPTATPKILVHLLAVADVCAATGFSRTKIMDLIRSGELPCVMVNKRIRVRADDLATYIDALPRGYVVGAKPPAAGIGRAKGTRKAVSP